MVKTITYRVFDPVALTRFYCDILGMSLCSRSGTLGYSFDEARLRFLPASTAYRMHNSDLYWKITLSVPDILLAVNQLAKSGVEVSPPEQFEDVGYLTHFRDPEGLCIELINHRFLDNLQGTAVSSDRLGGGAHLNLLTLRVSDLQKADTLLSDAGMKLVCVQPVPCYGFYLYFYATTAESPPVDNLESVLNREWLYQRRYTLLELQCHSERRDIRVPEPEQAGYQGFTTESDNVAIPSNSLLMTLTRGL